MKSLKFTLLALCALSIFSCKKKENIVVVEQDIPYVDTAELPGTGIAPLPINMSIPFDYAFATNYKTYLTQYNTTEDKVNSVKLKQFSISVLTPPGQNLDFLDTFRVYIRGNGLPTRLIAQKLGIPKGITTVNMDVQNEELKPYFLKDSVFVTVNGFINTLPTANTRFLLNSSFHLSARPLN